MIQNKKCVHFEALYLYIQPNVTSTTKSIIKASMFNYVNGSVQIEINLYAGNSRLLKGYLKAVDRSS